MANMADVRHGVNATYRGSSGALQWLTRIGFAAKGSVYFLVGILALMAAFNKGGGETTDQKGVIQKIASQPFGEFALIVIAVGLAAYALWRFAAAAKDTEHEGNGAKGSAKRIGYVASGIMHSALALFAFRIATGDPQHGDTAQTWSGRLLNAPMGELLLALIGLAVVGGGIYQMYNGHKEKFQKHLRMNEMSAEERNWAMRSGRLGYMARGLVFAMMGWFIVLAALRHDPSQAKGLEGALDTLAAQPFGQIVLAAVAAGLALYGVYCMVEARFRRVHM